MSSEVIRLLAGLIAFPTVSAVSNLDMLDHLENVVRPFGARTRRFANADGDKASLLISIGPEVPGGVVFSGHTDVVPTIGQAWTGDPWTLREVGSRVIGRGATDMKGFLACCLAALPSIATRPLKRPVHLAFSYDEEVGCTGVGDMAEWIGQNGLAPKMAIIGEATSMDLVSAHKGGLIGWARVRGKPGHSSQPDRYVNAVMAAAELIGEINRIRADMRSGPQFDGLDPPYSTIQVNQIKGGLHGNIVAEECDFFWEMRIIPGEDDLAVQARIPGLKPEAETLTGQVLDLLGRTTPRYVSYGTEAGIFQLNETPSFVVGPGDIADAHQPDEGIEIAELERCVAFLHRLGESCCDA
jgi:acetylornithine deacetylase